MALSTSFSPKSPVPINPLTVSAGSLAVEANGVAVAGSYAVSGSTVTFTPLTGYPAGSTVTVTLGKSVKPKVGSDSSGDA